MDVYKVYQRNRTDEEMEKWEIMIRGTDAVAAEACFELLKDRLAKTEEARNEEMSNGGH